MFPLRDTIRSRSVPVMNYSLIAINALIFLYEAGLSRGALDRLLSTFGLIPARLSLAAPAIWITILTSMFLHGSWFHVISNMWTLFIFGDNVEDSMGHFRYLAFYLVAGTAAALTQTYFARGSSVPTIGASGAIAGVLGAYFILFPRARVLTFLPIFILPWFVEIPAVLFLGIWFFSQISSGLITLGGLGAGGDFSGIAWWAHVGGFVFGVATVLAFVRRRTSRWEGEFPV